MDAAILGRVVQRVVAAHEQDALVVGHYRHGGVAPLHLYFRQLIVMVAHHGCSRSIDRHAEEHGRGEVIACSVPFHQIRYSRHNGCGLLECQIERAVRCVETVRAVCVQLHQRCTCEVRMRCYLRRGEVERQAQRVPLAILDERAAAEDNITCVAVSRTDVGAVVSIVSQEEEGVYWVKRLAVGLGYYTIAL